MHSVATIQKGEMILHVLQVLNRDIEELGWVSCKALPGY